MASGKTDQPTTLADVVKNAVRRIEDDGAPQQALVYTGNRNYAVPASLIHEPLLSAGDKLLWLVLVQHSQSVGRASAFPSYETIQRDAHLGSSATVSRSLQALRLTRWLSLCARVRDENGQFSGNVYAQHDEPLSVVEALRLDAGYLAFVDHTACHSNTRIARIAQKVRRRIRAAADAGTDPLKPESPIDRRIRRGREAESDPARTGGVVSNDRISGRHSAPNHPEFSPPSDRLHKVKAVPSDRLYFVKTASYISTYSSKSSSNNKNNTTTTLGFTRAHASDLRFPKRLNDNQRDLALTYLSTVPVEHRQAVLDELSARLAAEQAGASPVWDVLRYLHSLCLRARRGEFNPNLALTQTAQPMGKPQRVARPSTSSKSPEVKAKPGTSGCTPPDKSVWRQRFAQLGQELGVAAKPKSPADEE